MAKLTINIEDIVNVYPEAILVHELPRKKKKALKKKLSKLITDAVKHMMSTEKH